MKELIVKHPVRLFFGMLVAIYLMLSFSGFCISKLRYFSNEELIAKAILRASRSHISESVATTYDEAVRYFKNNPNCCRFVRSGFGEARTLPIQDLILARGVAIVHLYLPTAKRSRKEGKYYEMYVRMNCGEPGDFESITVDEISH